jgi:hypothetical protein
VGLGALVALSLALGGFGFLQVTAHHGPTRHDDGAGILASHNQVMQESQSLVRTPGVDSWTYGVRLCLSTGTGPATIESVVPDQTVGAGFKPLGMYIRRFVATIQHTPINSVDGFPPSSAQIPDALEQVAGFQVVDPCSNLLDATTAELLIGLAAVGDGGGGWKGLDITYKADGQEYILFAEYGLYVCGPATPCSGH